MGIDSVHRHPDTKTDRQLLEEARAGAGEMFEIVYRRHHAVILAFLVGRVEDLELADELATETFASLSALVENRGHPLPPVPVAWLLVTARHLVIGGGRDLVRDL
jgi:predicted RNA polymerase sigma factor